MKVSHFLSEYRKSWIISTLGIILYIFGISVLNVNEGRSYNHGKDLEEAFNEVTSFKDENYVKSNSKSEDYEGKLIHVRGELRMQEPIADSTYNLMVQCAKLRKIVQMYQWHEDFTENTFAEEVDQRSYYYFKDWNEKVVDSRSFHSMSHQNPQKVPIQSKVVVNEKVYIGNFELGDYAKSLFEDWNDVTSDSKPEDTYIKMHLGWYFHVEDLFAPLVGDVRVKFQFAGLEGNSWTVVGKLENGKIQPYKGRQKKRILLLSRGELEIHEIFSEERYAMKKTSWGVRVFGFFLIFLAVIATENLLKIASSSRLMYFSLDPAHKLKGYLRVAAIFAVSVCVIRQSLHHLFSN